MEECITPPAVIPAPHVLPPSSAVRRENGATLAEFAVTLPFLAVILYAIFDFGSALTL